MKTIRGLNTLPRPLPGSCLALGNFDGLHLGHQALIRATLEAAKRRGGPSVVLTFDPLPVQVLRPELNFKPLFGREDLVEQLASWGVDYVVLEPFSLELAKLSAEAFVQSILVQHLHPSEVVVGHDFAFGKDRQGSIETLKAQGDQGGFNVNVVPPILLRGERVSSSAIRAALREGRPERAKSLLGRNFKVRGIVESGAGRGQGLGIPTANMTIGDVQIPKTGVYVSQVLWGKDKLRAVTNVGRAPTFHPDSAGIRLETHILDQKLELRGVQLEVEFISYLREERRFDSVQELVSQIHQDIEAARNYRPN